MDKEDRAAKSLSRWFDRHAEQIGYETTEQMLQKFAQDVRELQDNPIDENEIEEWSRDE